MVQRRFRISWVLWLHQGRTENLRKTMEYTYFSIKIEFSSDMTDVLIFSCLEVFLKFFNQFTRNYSKKPQCLLSEDCAEFLGLSSVFLI